ncbi:uncharacterized protein CBL_04193 [Carabus blaptoides fortunei]
MGGTQALPDGAPTGVCGTMLPFHQGGSVAAQNSPSPFGIIPATIQTAENTKLKVTVGSRQGISFQGFMMHARTQDTGKLIGTFVTVPAGTKTMECSGPNDSVTHASPAKKGPQLDFEWLPPDGYRGIVVFNATVAQDYATFWTGLQSEPVRVMRQSEIQVLPTTVTPPSLPNTTPPHYTPEIASQAPNTDDPFYKGCFVEKTCFGAPSGCIHTKNCLAVVSVIVRGERYEFEMKAGREAAYVAVGLSDDDKMGDDSVIECVNQQNQMKAFMSRTTPRNNLNAVRLPRPQEGIQLLNFNITDSAIYCRVARDTQTNVSGRIYDLVKDRYFLLVAAGKSAGPNQIQYHDFAYLAAAESRFLSDVSEVGGASVILLRLHGVFMLVAWIGTASIGILLARYYRQTWVGSQLCGKDLWFAWHRFFMICTWALTVTGFILIFVELKSWSSERNPHAILGMITTIICFLQPIGAYFRPHPGTPKRSLFNWIHWLGGNVAHILGIVTIFFAVKLNKAELPDWLDWILVAFVAFHVLMHLVLSLMSWLQILGCISDRAAESRVTAFPMKDLGNNGRTSHNFDSKPDAPNSGLRKCILGLFIFMITLFVVAIVVIIVLAPVEQTWENVRRSMAEKK